MTVNNENNVPVMMIDLSETPIDRLDLYFKIMEYVETEGLDKSKCKFTWREKF